LEQAIERHKPLHETAEENFKELNVRNVTTLYGDGMRGWPTIHGIDQAPFDRIIVTAAAKEKPPQALKVLKRFKKESSDTYSVQDVMPVRFVPLLPDVDETAQRNNKRMQVAG